MSKKAGAGGAGAGAEAEGASLVDDLRAYVAQVESTAVTHEVDDCLLEPWTYILSVPGKNVRGVLIKCFNTWMSIDDATLEDITTIVRDLHTASLIIDDIEDGSKLRRGVPVAHSIYGVPFCINTANYVYFLAMEKCTNLQCPEATRVFLEEMLNLHRGQGWDIMWREHGTCPTEQQYRQMVLDKTGGLFRLAIRLMQAFSANKSDFIPLVETLALYFQIRDDYINLASATYMQNKSFCEDITEGKFSFLAIYAIHNNPGDHRLLNILKQRTDDVDKKLYALAYLRESGAFEYTRSVLRDLKADALAHIKALGGQPMLAGLLEKLDAQIDYSAQKDITTPTATDAPAAATPPTPPVGAATGAGAAAAATAVPASVPPHRKHHPSGTSPASDAAARAEAIASGRATEVPATGARPGPPLRRPVAQRQTSGGSPGARASRVSSSGSTARTAAAPGYDTTAASAGGLRGVHGGRFAPGNMPMRRVPASLGLGRPTLPMRSVSAGEVEPWRGRIDSL